MSTANRSKNPNWSKTARNTIRNLFRSRTKMVHLSKPVITNPKFNPESALNTEPQFILAPIRGRSYKAS